MKLTRDRAVIAGVAVVLALFYGGFTGPFLWALASAADVGLEAFGSSARRIEPLLFHIEGHAGPIWLGVIDNCLCPEVLILGILISGLANTPIRSVFPVWFGLNVVRVIALVEVLPKLAPSHRDTFHSAAHLVFTALVILWAARRVVAHARAPERPDLPQLATTELQS